MTKKNLRNIAMKGLLCLTAMIMTTLASCVNETLCEENHPHKAYVQFEYDWSKVPGYYQENLGKIDYLDSMYIIADRVINQRYLTFGFSTFAKTGKYKMPLTEANGLLEAPVWQQDDKGELQQTTLVPVTNKNIKGFYMPAGEYRFFTVNLDTKCYRLSQISETSDENMSSPLGNLMLENITYEGSDDAIHHPGEWMESVVDLNAYSAPDGKPAKFIANTDIPVVVDSTGIREYKKEEIETVKLTPSPVTQNIDIFFDIKKKSNIPFLITDVWCVISGIPHRVNIGTGALDVSHTDKMMCEMKFVDPDKIPNHASPTFNDTQDTKKLRCHSNVTVNGIVENTYSDANLYKGPGVMQLWIYTRIDNHKDYGLHKPEKIIQGCMNLHKSLKNAKLQTLDSDELVYKKTRDHSNLYLSFDCSITDEMLIGVNNAGIIKWEEVDVPDNFNIY